MARILVVEDNPDLRWTMQLLLEEVGHTAIVTDPEDVLDVASSLQPDLIFLDLHMDPLSGEEVFQRLKSTLATSHVPVVITSGVHDAAGIARGIGADGVLKKPYHLALLQQEIARLLGGFTNGH